MSTETPFEISSRFVDDWADNSPIGSTVYGIGGRDHLWNDFSLDGVAASRELTLSYQNKIAEHLTHPQPHQRHAARVLYDNFQTAMDSFEAGDYLNHISHIYDPFHAVKMVFELMPLATDEQWQNLTTRLQTIDQPLTGYREVLNEGIRQRKVAQRRQVSSVEKQARDLGTDKGIFNTIEKKATEADRDTTELSSAIEHARRSVIEYADYLAQTYLPVADPADGSGADRYLRGMNDLLGTQLDLEEVYQWGWDEIDRLRTEMTAVAKEIDPDKTIEEVRQLLDNDMDRAATSPEEFVDFVQRLQNEAVENLAGKHFEVADPIREVTVNLSPPGTPPSAHYIPPSEDLTRPGGIWYAVDKPNHIPLYQEVSTAYHEGFPGHHLQFGAGIVEKKLSRAHRLLLWKSGYGEGWALYAERLMEEFGYLENPDYRFGMLNSHVFRAARVVVDIGLHLNKEIPEGAPGSTSGNWDYDKAVTFMQEVGMQSQGVSESEVKRYLGWPAQAISYKIGEREILRIRSENRAELGDSWDAKEFHSRVLNNGPVRLDYLPEVVRENPVRS